MRQINITTEAKRLRTLADRFDTLHGQLLDDQPLTGTEGLRQLTERITQSQELVTQSLACLTALDGSQATQIQGAQALLSSISSVTHQAGFATATLTAAVHNNTYDANSWDPQQAEDQIGRGLRHLDARNKIAADLNIAAKELESCATACRYAATHLTRSADTPDSTATRSTTQAEGQAPATPPVSLTPTQHRALHAIAQGGARLRETVRGRMYVEAPGGQRITLATYNSLHKKGLVDRSVQTSLFTGQALTATDRAQAVLATLPPPGAALPAQPGPPRASAPRR